MFHSTKFNAYLKETLEQLNKKGGFLTTQNKQKINTMTIGWANIGIIWGKPIFTVAVRYSRYTYNIIDKSNYFTVSIPIKKDISKQLIYCGTHSGKNVNKFEECNLTLKDGQKVPIPIIEDCELHYECKILYKQTMEPGTLVDKIKDKYYKANDYHVFYYGEILNSYIKK